MHVRVSSTQEWPVVSRHSIQDPTDWHRWFSSNTHWAWAWVKVWPAAIISARRATAGSNIRLAAATTSSPLPVQAHIYLDNRPAGVDCTVTIQRRSLDVKGQEFPFFRFAFKYNVCVSFPVAYRRGVDAVASSVDIKRANYSQLFSKLPVYLMLFPTNTVQKKGTDSIFVGFCSMLSAATRPEVKEEGSTSTSIRYSVLFLAKHYTTAPPVAPSSAVSFTLSLWHLPVPDVASLVTSDGQRESGDITSAEYVWYIGPHELSGRVNSQGGTEAHSAHGRTNQLLNVRMRFRSLSRLGVNLFCFQSCNCSPLTNLIKITKNVSNYEKEKRGTQTGCCWFDHLNTNLIVW